MSLGKTNFKRYKSFSEQCDRVIYTAVKIVLFIMPHFELSRAKINKILTQLSRTVNSLANLALLA